METILSRSKCVKPFVITSLCDTQYLAFHFLGFAMYQTFMSLYSSTWNQYCMINVAFCIHDWNTDTTTTWWRHEWKHSPRYWPFVCGIHRCPGSPRTKVSDAWLFFFICNWINGWVNNLYAGDLRRRRAYYDVTAIKLCHTHTVFTRAHHAFSALHNWDRSASYTRSYVWHGMPLLNLKTCYMHGRLWRMVYVTAQTARRCYVYVRCFYYEFILPIAYRYSLLHSRQFESPWHRVCSTL